jgi:hypothetical protein
MTENPLKNREIIFEFFPVGAFIKVTAMDVATLTEVSIQGPANASKDYLQSNAMKRLAYVMRKKGIVA